MQVLVVEVQFREQQHLPLSTEAVLGSSDACSISVAAAPSACRNPARLNGYP